MRAIHGVVELTGMAALLQSSGVPVRCGLRGVQEFTECRVRFAEDRAVDHAQHADITPSPQRGEIVHQQRLPLAKSDLRQES